MAPKKPKTTARIAAISTMFTMCSVVGDNPDGRRTSMFTGFACGGESLGGGVADGIIGSSARSNSYCKGIVPRNRIVGLHARQCKRKSRKAPDLTISAWQPASGMVIYTQLTESNHARR